MFVALAQAGGASGLWPIASEQTADLLLITVLAIRSGALAGLSSRSLGQPILVGVSGMGTNLLYFFATHAGVQCVAHGRTIAVN
jgi:hypothetical protein